MTFFHPVHLGDLVMLKSQVNRVFRTSMEVGVKVLGGESENGGVRHTSSAYLNVCGMISRVIVSCYHQLCRRQTKKSGAGEKRRNVAPIDLP